MRRAHRKRLLVVASGVLVAVIAASFGLTRWLEERTRPRPSFLVITIDSLRPDHLGCYGNTRRTSPIIDALAARGVVFEQAVSQASWTVPSVTTLMTGTYPSVHDAFSWGSAISSSVPMLPRVLKRAGYRTAFMTSHPALPPIVSKLGLTFDEVLHADTDKKVCLESLRFMERAGGEPVFVWLHLMGPHMTHVMGASRTTTLVEKLGDEPEAAFARSLPGAPAAGRIKSLSLPPSERSRHALAYDEAIRRVDQDLGGLLAGLSERGLADRTAIVLTADHGEEMCERQNCYSHGTFLWDTLIHVPLVLWFPRALPRGSRVAEQVEHVDIAPTLLSLGGLPAVPAFQGTSLLALASGEKRERRVAFSEEKESLDAATDRRWVLSRVSARDRDFKLVVTRTPVSVRSEVYDLRHPPLDLPSTSREAAQARLRLTAVLDAWSRRMDEARKKNAAPRSAPSALDEATRRQLRSLGYVH
jgi:choline-sulfatase